MKNHNNEIVKIPVEELLESLRLGYIDYKECVSNKINEIDLVYTETFCVTLEEILTSYSEITMAEIKVLKRSILKDISSVRTEDRKLPIDIDYDIPTIFRQKFI